MELAPFAAVIANLFSIYAVYIFIGTNGDLKAAVYPPTSGAGLPCRFILNHSVPASYKSATPLPKGQMQEE